MLFSMRVLSSPIMLSCQFTLTVYSLLLPFAAWVRLIITSARFSITSVIIFLLFCTVRRVSFSSAATSVAVFTPDELSNDSVPGEKPSCIPSISSSRFSASVCSVTRRFCVLSIILSFSASSHLSAWNASSFMSKYRTSLPLSSKSVLMSSDGTIIRFFPSINSRSKLSNTISTSLRVSIAFAKTDRPSGKSNTMLLPTAGLKYTKIGFLMPLKITFSESCGNSSDTGTTVPRFDLLSDLYKTFLILTPSSVSV